MTHLLALMAGVGIYQGFRANAAGGKPADAVAQAGPAAVRDPGEAEVIRRLTDSREEKRRSREESAREESIPEPADTRSRSQRWLEMRAKGIEQTREELAALLKRAKDYEKTADLRVPLMATLLEDGNTDAAVAIFLEWHRRDPQGAFNELALRRDWSNAVLSEDAMMMFLKPEELLAQMDARNRSTYFRETLVLELADHLVETDDLQSLANYYAKLDPVWAAALMSRFASGGWLPRDGAAALAFVSNGMEESCRKALIAELADVHLNNISREWSEGIAAPLFRETLGEEKLTALRKEAEKIAGMPSMGGCCGGGGEDEIAGLPDEAAVAEILQEKTPEAFDRAVGRMLLHDKDYPELFAAGKITGDEALHDMMAALPGSEGHENEVRRAIYRKFAVWKPKAAVEWAAGHLTDEDLQSVAVDFEVFSEPRALRLLDLMEVLPSKFSDGESFDAMSTALRITLEDWRVLAPEVADAAMTRSPEAITLAERLKIEPVAKRESNVLPPLEEESNEPTPAE